MIARSRQVNQWILLCAAALLSFTLHALPVLAQDADAISVAEFVRQQPRWQRMQGSTLKIEGRRLALNDQRLMFKNCNLPFVLGEEVRVPTGPNKSVQVTGTLDTRQGKQVFVVSRLKEVPTDAETLADRRGRLTPDDASGWYTLADWAQQRGAFYDDSELLTSATDLRRAGLMIEYRQIALNDIPGLYTLAAKSEKLGLPPELRDQLIHDAVRRELKTVKPGDARQQLDVVLTHVLNRLPKSGLAIPLIDKKLPPQVTELDQKYQANPLETYEQADQDQRYLLHRLIYAHAQRQRIEMEAADDGSNGFKIAARIEKELPEFIELADEFREREIKHDLERVPQLTRDELLTLATRLEERERGGRASEIKREWLTAQEPKLREVGAGGLLDLAQEHIALLNDTEGAAAIYMELSKDRAGQATASARLVELGYQFDGNEWKKSSDGAPDGTDGAIRRGIVRKGMSSEQVRAAFGQPPSVVKFAVRGQISERWVYPDHGVAIEFSRRGPEGESTAVQVSELAGP
jgi:hypothetical protein